MKTDFSINAIIEILRKDGKLFVSESHFITEFIKIARDLYKRYDFVTGYPNPKPITPINNKEKYSFVDLLVITDKKQYIPIEFKYVVAGGEISLPNGVSFKLRNHSAIDVRRYNCVYDIRKLECYVQSKQFLPGYFILLTNMKKFWEGSDPNSVAADFELKDGSTLSSREHKVGEEKRNTSFYRAYGSRSINLNNSYHIKYHPYYKDETKKNMKFKYLVIKVK